MYNIKFAEWEFLSPEFPFSAILFKMTHGDVSSKISRILTFSPSFFDFCQIYLWERQKNI